MPSRTQYQPGVSTLPTIAHAAVPPPPPPSSSAPPPLSSASSRTAPLPPSPHTSSAPPRPSSSSSIDPYRSIPDVLRRTYAAEGLGGFYKGIATNAVRILPGTCVTFVVYEQTSRFLSRWAGRREAARRRDGGEMG